MSSHKLVVIEGIDGSGKSTQATLLKLYLESRYIPTQITKAKEKHQDQAFMAFVEAFELTPDSVGYMFLYQALHRRQYEVTTEALGEGKVVIADRWNPSYYAYHNLFGALSLKPKRLVREIDRLAFEGIEPGLCVFIDVAVPVAFERRIRRGEAESFSEEEHLFYEKVAEEYRRMSIGGKWVKIDGEMAVEDVHHQLVQLVNEALALP